MCYIFSATTQMKTIIFNEILSAVEQATEIDRALILSRSKQPDVVEARSLLFHYLYAEGFTRSQVARMTGHTRQCVSTQVTHFDDRKRYGGNIVSIMMQHIDNTLKRK
jgi:hypothetical protein